MEITNDVIRWVKTRVDLNEPIKYIAFKKMMQQIGSYTELYDNPKYIEVVKKYFMKEKLTKEINDMLLIENLFSTPAVKPQQNQPEQVITNQIKPEVVKPVETKQEQPKPVNKAYEGVNIDTSF